MIVFSYISYKYTIVKLLSTLFTLGGVLFNYSFNNLHENCTHITVYSFTNKSVHFYYANKSFFFILNIKDIGKNFNIT